MNGRPEYGRYLKRLFWQSRFNPAGLSGLELAPIRYIVEGMDYWTDKSRFHIIAHRGASAYAPDNSLEAFALAARYGATAIETDLQATADGQFVIRHDSQLGSGRFVSQLTYADYRKILAEQSEEPLKLVEAIEVAKSNDLGVYLEVKHITPRQIPALLGEIKASRYQNKIAIGSFRTDIIKTVKDISPRTPTSALFLSPGMDVNSLVAGLGCDFLHPCFNVTYPDPLKHFTPAWIKVARQTGAGLLSWNIADKKEAETVMALGIDGACADDPQIIVQALTGLKS